MSIDLLTTIQQNLGYPALQKIDPNTQQVVADEKTPDEDKFSQAAIPAVLTAMYKYVQSDEGATTFLQADGSINWIDTIFDDHKKEAIQTIASYAKKTGENPVAKMNAIATEAVKIVKAHLPEAAGIKEVKAFFKAQKATILLYLPTDLNMGELLHDNTLDYNTNKMEGPVSSLIQSIGAVFSTNATEEEIKSK
jgi:hypothetical protein